MSIIDYVDPFLGNTTTSLAEDWGIAMAWSWPKAETGNTHPGAALPFGMVTACPYSGGYVTGYGCNLPSTKGPPQPLFDRKTATGFTHFHPSGTGMIGAYYNYLRAWPAGCDQNRRWTLRDERARPGSYACTLEEAGVRVELTVSRHCALHRYRSFEAALPAISVDLSNIALDGAIHEAIGDASHHALTAHDFEILEDRTVVGSVTAYGIRLFFALSVDGTRGVRWWDDAVDATRGGERLSAPAAAGRFGVELSLPSETQEACLRIGFSFRSVERARAHLEAEASGRRFDATVDAAEREWEGMLSRIRVRGDAEHGGAERTGIFYTALYHSLIKPMDCSGENPFYDIDGACSVDLATLWDQSKTLLPLLNTLYPDAATKVVDTLRMIGRRAGRLPNALILARDHGPFDEASGLAYLVLADALMRRGAAADWEEVLSMMLDTFHGSYADFIATGSADPPSKAVNLSRAAAAILAVQQDLTDSAVDRRLAAASRAWRKAFDRSTGLLRSTGTYYEGSHWNYSFPLLHDEAGRLALFPDERRALETVDRFFGYYDSVGDRDAPAPFTAPRLRQTHEVVAERFEGLNNEPDLDAPWTYHYLGRPDRTAEVVKSALRSRFATGPGGLPGNDDSGATSSWFVWAATGLFPVLGRPLYLLTLPEFPWIELSLPHGAVTIIVEGYSDSQVYIASARLNGSPLERSWLTHEELDGGAELRLTGSSTPPPWAQGRVPPSVQW